VSLARRGAVLGLAALALLPPGAAAAARCGADTPLTLVGFDTAAGTALFSLRQGDRGWLLEASAEARVARLYPDLAPDPGSELGRAGASLGPGPPLAGRPCGRDCLQPLVWESGRWRPLGEPVTARSGATLHGTWDRGGAAWLVLLGGEAAPGTQRAAAFRLAGRDWEARGVLQVADVAAPAALPVPDRADAIVAGSGLFSAGGPPGQWLHGLPELPPGRRGAVYPLGGQSAAHVAADGAVYATRDQGRTWRRPLWTPWGQAGVEAWKAGEDYTTEAAASSPRSPLGLLWLDRRGGERAQVHLSELAADGSWRLLATLADRVRAAGAELELGHFMVADDGRWLLVAGCVETRGSSSLVLRALRAGRLGPPRLVPVELAPPGD
jgi:hypothetical protein